MDAGAVYCGVDVRTGSKRAEHGDGEIRDGRRDVLGDAAKCGQLHGDVHGAGDGEL